MAATKEPKKTKRKRKTKRRSRILRGLDIKWLVENGHVVYWF